MFIYNQSCQAFYVPTFKMIVSIPQTNKHYQTRIISPKKSKQRRKVFSRQNAEMTILKRKYAWLCFCQKNIMSWFFIKLNKEAKEAWGIVLWRLNRRVLLFVNYSIPLRAMLLFSLKWTKNCFSSFPFIESSSGLVTQKVGN